MNNFEYYIPTKVLFGENSVEKISKEIPLDQKVMLVYGQSSIKKNGIYNDVIQALNNYQIVEFGGVMPNPKCEYLQQGIDLAKKEKVQFLLAIGGGSVIDATKFIAAGYYVEGEAWSLISEKKTIDKALPMGTVLTLPATSSEMNYIGVISSGERKEKFSFRDNKVFPIFSVLDPTYTKSLSKKQLGYGLADTFMHILEQYLNNNTHEEGMLQDFMAEGMMKVLLHEGRTLMLEESFNYVTRSNLMWTQAWGLNSAIQMGLNVDLATHKIGHELTALFGVPHAVSLTVVYPLVLKLIKKYRPKKLQRLGSEVFNIQDRSAEKLMNSTIDEIVSYFKDCGLPVSLAEANLPSDSISKVCDRFRNRQIQKIGGMQDIDIDELEALFFC